MKRFLGVVGVMGMLGVMLTGLARGQDKSGVTERFRNGATVSLDTTSILQDEYARWTLSNKQLGLLSALQGGSVSNDFSITATVTVTATPTNGQTILLDGIALMTWTWSTNIVNAATQIPATNSTATSATNLLVALTNYPVAGLTAAFSSSTALTLTAATNLAPAITLSAGWGTVTYSTNIATTATLAFAPSFASPPAVLFNTSTNSKAALLSVSATNAVIGSAVTNGWFQWMAIGPR